MSLFHNSWPETRITPNTDRTEWVVTLEVSFVSFPFLKRSARKNGHIPPFSQTKVLLRLPSCFSTVVCYVANEIHAQRSVWVTSSAKIFLHPGKMESVNWKTPLIDCSEECIGFSKETA